MRGKHTWCIFVVYKTAKKMTSIPNTAEQFYLRFTLSPEDDMKYKKSIWITYECEKPVPSEGVEAEWNEKYECWVYPHKGLSGHQLWAETLEEAIEEVKSGRWFANPKTTSWAIYAGDCASDEYGVSTPEGDDFTPVQLMHFEEK